MSIFSTQVKKRSVNYFVPEQKAQPSSGVDPTDDDGQPREGQSSEFVISSAQPHAIPYEVAHTRVSPLAQIDKPLDVEGETAKAEKEGPAALTAQHAYYTGEGEQSRDSFRYPHHDNKGSVYLSAVKACQHQLDLDSVTPRKVAGRDVAEKDYRVASAHLQKHASQFGFDLGNE